MQIYSTSQIKNSSSVLDVSYFVSGGERESDFGAQAKIPFRRNFVSTAELELIKFNIPSTAYVLNEFVFSGMAKIPTYGDLDITFQTVQPPLLDLNVSCTKDTYSRQARPTSNYGTAYTLICGQGLDGLYYTYLEFNVSSIIQKYNSFNKIRSIVLTLKSPELIDDQVQVTEVVGAWEENSLTWRGSPTEGNIIPVVQHSTLNTLIIDITDYVLSLADKGRSRLSLKLSSSTDMYFYSRDTNYAPLVTCMYSDMNWNGYVGESSQYSKAKIVSRDNRDLLSSAQLIQFENFISISVIQKIVSDVQSSANLMGFYNSPINSKVDIIGLTKDILSLAMVQVFEKSSLSSSAYVQSSQFPGKSNIRQIKDILSRATIQGSLTDDLFVSTAGLYGSGFSSAVQIIEHTAINSIAELIALTHSDLHSSSEIRLLENLLTSITRITSNIQHSNLLGNSALVNPMHPGKAFIKNGYNLQSLAVIRNTPQVQINSFANLISNNEEVSLLSTAYIEGNKSELFSNTAIRVNLDLDLTSSSNIDLIKNNLTSKCKLIAWDVISSSAIIIVTDLSEVTSYATLFKDSDLIDLISSATIIRTDTDLMTSKAIILSDARRWIPNVHSPIIFNYIRKFPRIR